MPVRARWVLLAAFLTAPLGLAASGCVVFAIDKSEEAAAVVRAQDLDGLPYHPLVYHLDLSILAYQLYTQSLYWPFDPYYEELATDDDAPRDAFMDVVREWAAETGAAQVAAAQAGAPLGLDEVRGPGVLAGFEDNPLHDPILYQYRRVHPWATALAKPLDNWVEYKTPSGITEQIAEAHVCTRATGGALGEVSIAALPVDGAPIAPGARDVLLVIEGGTGDKGEPDQPASWSLMAFALLRAREGDAYDLHIAFRGSRSGDGTRAATQALSTDAARGNPDWITDLGYREVYAPDVSPIGQVSRGMASSVASIVPQLLTCLDAFAGDRPVAPSRIFLTGHSLGGGLAQHLASAVLLGDRYGPAGDAMPTTLRAWPWEDLKLITYSAPRVGDADWALTLTRDALEAQPFVHVPFGPWDAGAIGVTDPAVLPRLTDPDRPAAYRVLIHTDPITSGIVQGGEHVGTSVYLDVPAPGDESRTTDFSAHEPMNVRARMVETLRDERIPAEAWAYREHADLVPDRDASGAGTLPEFAKLKDATVGYYRAEAPSFDAGALEQAFAVFELLLEELATGP